MVGKDNVLAVGWPAIARAAPSSGSGATLPVLGRAGHFFYIDDD